MRDTLHFIVEECSDSPGQYICHVLDCDLMFQHSSAVDAMQSMLDCLRDPDIYNDLIYGLYKKAPQADLDKYDDIIKNGKKYLEFKLKRDIIVHTLNNKMLYGGTISISTDIQPYVDSDFKHRKLAYDNDKSLFTYTLIGLFIFYALLYYLAKTLS